MERKLSAAEHRANARRYLGNKVFGNNWMLGLLVLLLQSLIVSFASSLTVGLATIIITGPLMVGVSLWFLAVSREGSSSLETMFCGFSNDFAQNILIGFMTGLFTFLWSLLFVIPGIVKSYSYSMAYYIKCDHPEYNWKQCIDESRRIMNGHKWQLFCLDLSFIGWILLACLTFGIGTILLLWISPYMTAARTSFYNNLVANDGHGTSYAEEGFFQTSGNF